MVLLVGKQRAPIREHDLGREQLVHRQPVPAPENPDPAAERQPGDPDRRTTAGHDRPAMRVQRVVHGPKPGSGTHAHGAVGDLDRVHQRGVDDDLPTRRAPGEAVTSTADRDRQPSSARECQRFGDILGRPAAHDRLRLHVPEGRNRRLAYQLIVRRPRQQHVAGDRALERAPAHATPHAAGRCEGRRRYRIETPIWRITFRMKPQTAGPLRTHRRRPEFPVPAARL